MQDASDTSDRLAACDSSTTRGKFGCQLTTLFLRACVCVYVSFRSGESVRCRQCDRADSSTCLSNAIVTQHRNHVASAEEMDPQTRKSCLEQRRVKKFEEDPKYECTKHGLCFAKQNKGDRFLVSSEQRNPPSIRMAAKKIFCTVHIVLVFNLDNCTQSPSNLPHLQTTLVISGKV